jgi:hypothetical protein
MKGVVRRPKLAASGLEICPGLVDVLRSKRGGGAFEVGASVPRVESGLDRPHK